MGRKRVAERTINVAIDAGVEVGPFGYRLYRRRIGVDVRGSICDIAEDAGADAAQQRRAQRRAVGQFGHLNRLPHERCLDLHEQPVARDAADGRDGCEPLHPRIVEERVQRGAHLKSQPLEDGAIECAPANVGAQADKGAA